MDGVGVWTYCSGISLFCVAIANNEINLQKKLGFMVKYY